MATEEKNLAAMTIVQLMALCREHKLTGYSKLKKGALVEKLQGYYSSVKQPQSTVSNPPVQLQDTPSVAKRSKAKKAPKTEQSQKQEGSSNDLRITEKLSSKSKKHDKPPSKVARETITAPSMANNATVTTNSISSFKRLDVRKLASNTIPTGKTSSMPPPPIVPVRQLNRSLQVTQTTVTPDHKPTPEAVRTNSKKRAAESPSQQVAKKPRLEPLRSVSQNFDTLQHVSRPLSSKASNHAPTRKMHFAPLVPNKSKMSSAKAYADNTPPPVGMLQQFMIHEPYKADDAFLLSNIKMPPTITQRRRVKPLALVLKGLDNTSRHTCCQASRMLRYAVYASAQYVLLEVFPGERAKAILARADDCISNLWPYIQYRRREVTNLKQLYSQTFLARYIPRPFSNRLWGSIERGDELVNGLRFLISMFWASIGMDREEGRQFLDEILHSLELFNGEQIMRAKILKEDGSLDTFMVLAATGEPLGRAQPTGTEIANPSHLRVDWSNFLQQSDSNVWDHLHCANSEDYVRGISKAWLQRAHGSDMSVERQVAERYILASVVENSISGRQMNHMEMAAMDAGRPLEPSKRSKGLSLYLSEHNHVESVYIGPNFHPAIACVQTTRHEYYVLRETGQGIGTGEGVAEVWQEILQCNANGTVKA